MNLQGLPSVEQLLKTKSAIDLAGKFSRPLTVQAVRTSLEDARSQIKKDDGAASPGSETLLTKAANLLYEWTTPALQPVINASGVILHTNLGRSPLPMAAIRSIAETAGGYSNLEYDLEDGKRGSRQAHVESLLTRVTGAPSAMVVNNNAAAVLLILSSLAAKKRLIIARSQLVEIGDGFRIPDVMKQSGAKLVEVGTTNQVHLADYEQALSEPAAMVMLAHRSNFKMIGFISEPDEKEIADLAHRSGVLFVEDLGSGAVLPTERYGLAHEPMVQEALAAGADLVCFSGDKLLGGPQAGIIVGKAELVSRIRRHPLARAVRADKLCLAALAVTLIHYLKNEAEIEIPIWRMISATTKQLKRRAKDWIALLGQGQVLAGESTVGGGSLPGESLPTWLLVLTVRSPNQFLEQLRHLHPPIIARTSNNRVLLDPRTVLPELDETLLGNLKRVL